jgi:group I intron endonuclease
MFYLIYKITNLINGKIYIGSHKTMDINDSYMGSGKYLINAQRKYGILNFTKEILFVFDNPTEMYAKEAELVNDRFLSEENTYNLKRGGFGGFDYINSRPDQFLTEKRLNCLKLGSIPGTKGWLKKFHTDETFKKTTMESMRQGRLEKCPDGTFYGKQHKESTKMLIGSKNSLSQAGEKNSQFGTIWITNGTSNSKIKTFEPIPNGWRKGRTTKK